MNHAIKASGLAFLAALSIGSAAAQTPPAELLSVRKIWDHGGHNAFTGLTRFHEQWFCVFREAKAHVSPDGTIRVLRSRDGQEWQSSALIDLAGFDLRDPKVEVTPDGKQMMIVGGATVRDGAGPAKENQSFTTFSGDGSAWDPLHWAGPTNHWLWRTTWHEGKAYGVAYDVAPGVRAAQKYGTKLLVSEDGLRFNALVPQMFTENGPTEATLRFGKDGTGYCLQRRDGKPSNTAVFGTAKPPYTDWQWKDMGKYFGGPEFIQLPDGRWFACGRLFKIGEPPQTKTVLCELDVKSAELKPVLTLPSGGDSSYPGMVWHDGQLWISYYSSHEGRTSIYFAQIKVR